MQDLTEKRLSSASVFSICYSRANGDYISLYMDSILEDFLLWRTNALLY